MAITGTTIQGKVSTVLNDAGTVRWTGTEILGWINSGQREIVVYKPSASASAKNLALVAGTRQAIAGSDTALLSVVRNMGTGATSGKAITLIDRAVLDAAYPGWHQMANANAVVRHYMVDERNQDVFYVEPPQPVGTDKYVEIVAVTPPTDLAALSSNIALDDVYETVLIDYVLYRAFSKDTTSPANLERAAKHEQAFFRALGVKTAVEAATSAKREGREPPPQAAQ
jgi:hypothetical protein